MIDINSLSFSYRQGFRKHHRVLDNISITVPAGRAVGILGANGVGKSTLLKILSGALTAANSKTAEAPNLKVMGFEPRKRQSAYLAEIYLVPEEFELPEIKGTAYVSLFSAFYEKFDTALFDEIAKNFELDCDKVLTNMSFGQRKKFYVAFALATRCRLIIMDEPTNGMDIPSKSAFKNAIIKNQTAEQTILISSHQVRDLDSIIDSVLLMNDQQAHWNNLAELTDSVSVVQGNNETASHNFDVIHTETRMGTPYCLVAGNHNQNEIDLEMIFNAFHHQDTKLLSAIKSSTQEEQV
jgi:ABC-2 type transport system ATP-binding protein